MQAGTYTFSCRFDTDALLPAFKGSTLRGGLGQALKQITCALRKRQCNSCMLFSSCVYAFLFEKKNTSPATPSPPAAHPPHPYVLVPPAEKQRDYSAGTPFAFSLLLFGRANDYLPHVIYAVQEMGRAGLGKNTAAKGQFRLESVHLGDTILYNNGNLTLPENIPELIPVATPEASTNTLGLTCKTPVRLKHNNRFRTDLPFHLLVRAALRRISSLEAAYGNGEPALDYKGLAARATAVRNLSENCQWVEIERYSNRQQTAMLIGGVLGSNLYQGDDLAEFLPLLRYCEVVHLGKQTSFGLGRIVIATETVE